MSLRLPVATFALISLCPLPLAAAPTTTTTSSDNVKKAMPRLLVSLSQALVGLEDPALTNPERRKADKVTHQGLLDLSRSGALMAQHAKDAPPGMKYLANQVVNDSTAAFSAFTENDREATKRLIWRVSDSCVGCHARLPEQQKSPLGEILIPSARLEKFDLLAQAHLFTATRRFDDALDRYAQYFKKRSIRADTQSQHMKDYFKVALRVRNDTKHPLAVLDSFKGRSDIPAFLETELSAWKKSLKALSKGKAKDSLKTAKALIKKGDKSMTHPWERNGLVYYVAASGMLNRLIENPKTSKKDRAQAYLLIVHTDFRIDQAYPVVLATDYLDAAIRTAPKTKTADDAYALLERIVNLQKSPNGQPAVSPDEAKRLAALKKMTTRK